MERTDTYEQEIDLKDMLFHVLYRWRSLLLVAALAAGLAGGYVSWYNGTSLPEKRGAVQEQLEEQERMLGALAEGQSAEPIQKQMAQLKEELAGLEEYSYVRYCLLGAIGGLLVLAFCYGFSYACSDSLRGERELKDRYGYSMLGVFPRARKKKLLSCVDRLLERLEEGSGRLPEAEVYKIVAVNMTNLAKTGGMFLVTGTVDKGKLEGFVEAVVPQLEENVTLVAGWNMNRSAGTLEALAECDAVVLVEERGRSLRREIQKEHEGIAALGKPVVGYVVL